MLGKSRDYAFLLLLVPFIALFWVPIYAREAPAIFGVPFFYWYQFILVPLTSLIVGAVYMLETWGRR